MAEKILIVDDDLETLRLIGMILQRQGYQSITATSGDQAITLMQTEKPDLIILDVMMPDMDGFQVARHIRKHFKTAEVPILMFTAKTQVEDKVAGYDSGVDDYLTKPIHPAELVARVKTLTARGKQRSEERCDRGYVLAVVAPRGGLGASSLSINLALAYHSRTRNEVIAAEMHSGRGSWVYDLGLPPSSSLSKLLRLDPTEITIKAVEQELTRTNFGVRLLLASNQLADVELAYNTNRIQTIIQKVACLAKLLILDIGAPGLPDFDSIIEECDELILITEPYPGSMKRTRELINELAVFGVEKTKRLTIVALNRIRADIQLTVPQIEEALEHPIAINIPAFPEMAYQAALRLVPLIQVQPESVVAQQVNRLAAMIEERIPR
ncbi:MAG: response regulator [Anaerolineaceae bacterium]|nr:response regulator [Anaerolineaceae bacterium]